MSLVLLFVARAVASFLGEYTTSWISRRVIFDLRHDCFSRLLKLPCGFYDINPSGRLVAKLIFDVEQIAGAVTQGLVTVVGDGLTAAFLLGYMFYLDWKLTLLLLVVAPVTGAFVYLGYRFLLRRGYRSGIGFAAGTTAVGACMKSTPSTSGAAMSTASAFA